MRSGRRLQTPTANAKLTRKEEKKMKKNTTPKPLNKWDIINYFQDYDTAHGYHYGNSNNDTRIYAVIVFDQSNFCKNYIERERSYIIDNECGKACFVGMISNSLVGSCLDGTDPYVRLDCYNWKVERCYFSDKYGNEIPTPEDF